ncbi:MAG TPA: ferredoxin--NADP reductase [Acidimicrobiales bacterium]|nr:ferredoxin--NADP reductase [Acidimicrobiales bacterium]
MGEPATGAAPPGAARDHHFHPLRVARVVRETPDASSFVLDVPPSLRQAFAYRAGQFCTFRATVDGRQHLRCYSMSSAPEVDDELQVTVKRVPGGAVSNWMNDALAEGGVIEATCPAGVFVLGDSERDIVAFAGGSGITPVFSLIKAALALTARRVHLLYANRDAGSVIFGDALRTLAERHPGRLRIEGHLDTERGYVTTDEVRRFMAAAAADAEYYICGPGPFMALVEAVLVAGGAVPERVHIELFTVPDDVPAAAPSDAEGEGEGGTIVSVEVEGRSGTAPYRPGTTILQTARQLGLSPPSSCEAGNCATCMAKLLEGSVAMRVNNALTDDEVAAGWVLTCQAVPTAPTVRVVYGYGD